MAKQEVGLKIDVDVSSVGNIKKELKAATLELIAMQQQFGKSSEQAINAAKKVANLKDTIQDAKEQADLFDPGNKFKAFSNAATQVAAGFTAVQGAMALVGSESEDVQKSLLKVQGALALSQGLSQIGDLGKAFDELKIVAVKAFRSIKAAIGSTGIGLLVVALGAVVAYWDDIKAAVSGVSEEQKKLNAEAAKRAESSKKDLDNLSLQENSLKLQGKTEREILKIRVEKTKQAIEDQIRNIKALQTTNEIQEKTAARNKEILQGILTFISTPIAALLKGVDLIGEAVGKNFDLYNKFYGTISSLVFNPEKERAQGAKTIEEQNKVLMELQSDLDGHNFAIRNIDKAAADKSAADQEKINADKLKKQQEADKVLNDSRRAQLTEQQKEEQDALIAFEQNKKTLQLAGITNFLDVEIAYQIQLQDIRKKYRDKEKEEADKEREEKLKKDKSAQEKDIANKQAQFETIRKNTIEANAALVNAEVELQNAKFEAASAGLNALSTLAGDNEKLANVLFAIDKGLAIAKIIVDTQREIGGYFAANAVKGLPGAAIAAKQSLAAKIRAGASIATIIATSIAKFKKGGGSAGGGAGGGGGVGNLTAPVSPQLSPQVTATQVNTAAVNQMGNQATRAYVLNSDIQNNDQRNAYINRNASIGNP